MPIDRTPATPCILLLAFTLAGRGLPEARAQAEDQAAARTFFEEGRSLVKNGDYTAACPKFEAAARLYAGPGVLLNLGDCYEHAGRTASAWAEFAEAEAAAGRAGRAESEAEAHARKLAIEPRLSRLVVSSGAQTPGLSIRRDGQELESTAWGVAVPVDPGSHVVTAEAPGRVAWSASVTAEEGKTIAVEVPELQRPAPAPFESAPKEPHPLRAGWTARQTAGAAAGVAGVLGLAVAVGLAVDAKERDDRASGESFPDRHSDSASALREGNIATGLAVGGALVAAAGFIVWVTAPKAMKVTGGRGSLGLSGSF